MAELPNWDEGRARAIIAAHHGVRGGLLPMLHDLQAAFGAIDDRAVPALAEALNISTAEVFGVVTFYHDVRRTAPGRHTVRLCRAEACQAVGADRLADHVRQRLGVEFGATTACGAVSLEPVACLGNCALGPAMTLDGTLHGRVTPQRFDALTAPLRPEESAP